MKTQVQLYEIEDVRIETPAQSEEALALIESLGLKGQATQTETKTDVRFPYRQMLNEEQFVFSVLCPSKHDVHAYADPIPLEVLKTLAYAKSLKDSRLGYFEVWTADASATKDPVLVGRKTEYSGESYLLARWGDELLPIEVLLPDALKRWWAKRIDKLNELKRELDAALAQSCPHSAPRENRDPYLSI
jgi:hypothetical protein